ncbi:histidine triad nucleotide-binding protein [Desulfotalea psychrophila]|uniref:Probable histidine triad nucleotide-binding protein (HIT) n=1 Tax=Desulfotalea psychrophila (strain LSv54 / DSM 12343) TaxID=177439 RepID=Q6APV9_DESPS|nr:histidine triad nucleotide-binding protein [Desulfotalea psychrophila]CAG35614.1 probable histidine triad nucleotide-binding protein (HIT) [Desulfotalea psychrophila LSv54]
MKISGDVMSDCLFCKIIGGEIPVKKLYEDDDVFAFWDIAPQAPKHFLVVPKKHITGPADLAAEDEQLIGKMMRVGAQLAKEQGIGDGFRTVLNNGIQAGQTVFHIHMHILGGRDLQWPPG